MRRTFEGIEAITQYWSNQPLGQPVPNTAIAGRNVLFDNGRSRTAGTPVMSGTVPTDTLGKTGTVGAGVDGVSDRIEFADSLSTLRAYFAPFSWVLVGRELHVVRKLIANGAGSTMLINPSTLQTGSVIVYRTPTMFPLQKNGIQRGSLFAGNAVQYRGEAYFGVGRGTLAVDGSTTTIPLPVTSAPKIAYPNGATYDIRPAGFSKPDVPTVTALTGGTKGMKEGERGFRICHAKMNHPGRNLPSDTGAYATIAADGKFSLTASALPTVSDGTDAIEIYVTKRNDARTGPWYLYKKVAGAGPHEIEFLDEELGDLLRIDNYPPPPCLRVVDFGDLLLYVSFSDSAETPDSFAESGAGIAVAGNSNPEASPTKLLQFVMPAQPIVGAHVGLRYVFFLTENNLNVGQRTANNVQPLVVFPYGQTGFAHQGNGIVINDVFYGLTGAALVTTNNGENMDSTLGFPIKRELEAINPARALLAYDAKAQRLVIFHNMAVKAESVGAKWQCLAYSVNLNDIATGRPTWNAPVLLGDGVTADFHVTGQVTIGQDLFFCTSDGNVYAWDKGGSPTAGFLASNFASVGQKRFRDAARMVKIAGGINGTMRFFRDLNYTGLIANDASGSASFALANIFNESKHYPAWKLRWPGQSFAIRFDFEQAGGTLLLEPTEYETRERSALTQ